MSLRHLHRDDQRVGLVLWTTLSQNDNDILFFTTLPLLQVTLCQNQSASHRRFTYMFDDKTKASRPCGRPGSFLADHDATSPKVAYRSGLQGAGKQFLGNLDRRYLPPRFSLHLFPSRQVNINGSCTRCGYRSKDGVQFVCFNTM